MTNHWKELRVLHGICHHPIPGLQKNRKFYGLENPFYRSSGKISIISAF